MQVTVDLGDPIRVIGGLKDERKKDVEEVGCWPKLVKTFSALETRLFLTVHIYWDGYNVKSPSTAESSDA